MTKPPPEIAPFLDKKVVNRANEGITEHAGSPANFDQILAFKMIFDTQNTFHLTVRGPFFIPLAAFYASNQNQSQC